MPQELQTAIVLTLFLFTPIAFGATANSSATPASATPMTSDFAEHSVLENEFKAFCLKSQVTNDPAEINVFDSANIKEQKIHRE